MHEMLKDENALKQINAAVRKSLQDIDERSQNPDLLDRLTLPVDRWVTKKLAEMLGMTPEETA